MYFPILIIWTSPFQILGLLGGVFHFDSNFKRIFCKQTVENLIRRRVLRRVIWFAFVCRCPTKRTLGLFGLSKATHSHIFSEFIAKLEWTQIGPGLQKQTNKQWEQQLINNNRTATLNEQQPKLSGWGPTGVL